MANYLFKVTPTRMVFFLYYILQGITFKDYLDFFCFMRNISEADMALSFHNAAGKLIDPGIQFLTGSGLIFHNIFSDGSDL